VTQAGRCPLINERRVGIISRSSSTYYQTRQFGPPLTRCYNRFTLNGPSIKYTKLHSGFDSSRACASGLAPPNANPFAAAVLLRGINSVICNRALVFVAANARIRSRVSAESTALRCEIDFPPRTWMSSNAARRSWRGKVTARVPLSLSLSRDCWSHPRPHPCSPANLRAMNLRERLTRREKSSSRDESLRPNSSRTPTEGR